MSLTFNLIPIKDLARGLDLRSAETNIGDGYSENLENVITVSSGHLEKRPGYQGVAGYVPFRVKEVSHDGYQISLKLDRVVNLTGNGSTPILVYGKLPQAESGDYSTTAALKYYAAFSVDVRDVFSPTGTLVEKTSSDHGFSTSDLDVFVLTSTNESDNDNSFSIVDSVTVNAVTYAVDITYVPAVTERVFILILDKSASGGDTYVADYSAAAIAPSGGFVTGTILAATHGLGSFNIIPKFYSLSAGVYTEFIPDECTIDDSTGDVGFSFTAVANFDGKVVLDSTASDNFKQVSIGASSTGTITVTGIETSYPYWALYRLSSSTWYQVIPDSVTVDDSADTLTVTITNAELTGQTYEFYYDFATIPSNIIRVVDSSATTTSYTGTTITEPALTVWGIDHADKYAADATRGGHVLHLDSYKRESESRLVAGLGGNLHAQRTRSEVGTTYQMPSYTVDLDARIATAAALAPLFQVTGTAGTVRTRGIITGGNVSGGYAVVTGAAYVSGGVVDYTLSLTSKVGTLALNTQVAATDYLTVTGMARAEHNGTFKITAVTDAVSSVVIRVSNSAITSADLDESGAAGGANVFTDRFTTTAATNYIVGDEITADSIDDDLTLAVSTVSTTTVTVSGVTEAVSLAQGVSVFGTRTSYTQPLKNSSSVPSVTYFVPGDMVTLTNYLDDTLTRQPRVTHVHPFHDMTCTITVSSGTATLSLGGEKTVSAVNTGTDRFTATAHGFSDNDPIMLSTTESLPDGMRTDAVYFADVIDVDTFKLLPKEDGSSIDLTSAGSGTITAKRVHSFKAGQLVTVSQTGDPLLDGVVTVVNADARDYFTFTTTSVTASATGVLVGRTLQFDESLVFSDALNGPTTVTVSDRWVPIEAPTATGGKPKTTYVNYFDDEQATVRSCMVNGSMFFATQTDELMKFDGTNLYQAGLFRWQAQLFAQVDTGTGSLTLDAVSAVPSAISGNKITVGTGEAIQFKAGDRVVYSNDSSLYTVQSVDIVNNFVYTTTSVTVYAGGKTLKKVKTYRYYMRLNAIDANNNVVASAVTGSEDTRVELAAAGQIRLRLLPPPVWGMYDYDRIEVQVYRTAADTVAPYYRIRSVPVTFSTGYQYIDIYDSTPDDVLVQSGDQDATMVALLGAELGTAWEQPPRAKYVTSTNNKLVLANIKDYQQLDIVLKKQASAASVTTSNLNTQKFTFRRDSTDTLTTTSMADRVVYEFVNSGAVTITPNTDIARTSTTFTITKVAHGLVVGDWAYLYHAAAGADNDLHFAGWAQVNAKTADTFTVKFANGYTPSADDVDTYVCATAKANVPVWLGTDGNYNQKDGNSSGSYELLAATRLASAINASMVATDVTITGQTTFVPWLTAAAGGEYQLGQVVVRQPKYAEDTMEVFVGTVGSNYDVYVNNTMWNATADASGRSATSRLFPSRVLISYENHPEIFDAPGVDIATDSDSAAEANSADGEEITGIIPFFGATAFSSAQVESLVVVFKTNSVYLLDIQTRQVQKIDSQGVGCTVPLSIAATRNGIMFANLSGVYRLNRNLTVSYVGKMVERYWKDDVNHDQLALATGHNYGIGRQYKLSVPVDADAVNSTVLVYDHTREGDQQEFGAWSKYTNHPATGWANLDDDSYFATTVGQVFRIRTANDASDYRDDASAITSVILLKAMDAGMPGVRKVVRNAVVHMRMDKTAVTATTVEAAVDNSTVFEDAGTITAALGTKRVETFRVALPSNRLTHLQLKFTNAVKDETFVLAGLDLLVAVLTGKGVQERQELS